MLKQGLIIAILFVVSGCAQIPEAQKHDNDPLQSINRPIYDFNMDILDAYILRPATVGYVAITPQPVRRGLVNFTDNIDAPIDAINAGFQGKPAKTGISLARFLVNSTVGIFGIFDVATELGLIHHQEDFGQTLGVWGVGNGPYLTLPAYGPSTVRNVSGDLVDGLVLPTIALSTPQSVLLFGLKALEARASLMPQEALLKEALDPYIFMKDIYLQRQLYELYDGNPPIEKDIEEFDDAFLENL